MEVFALLCSDLLFAFGFLNVGFAVLFELCCFVGFLGLDKVLVVIWFWILRFGFCVFD